MNAKNAKRAEILTEAFSRVSGLKRVMRKMKGPPPAAEGDRWAMQIAVGATCDDGCCFDAWIELDLATAKKLLPHIEDVIGDELAKLGPYPKKARAR